jgi:hypothetical protein
MESDQQSKPCGLAHEKRTPCGVRFLREPSDGTQVPVRRDAPDLHLPRHKRATMHREAM